MGDDNTTEQQKRKRKSKWTTSYSNMTTEDAEDRLGFRIETLERQAIPVETILAEAKYRQQGDAILKNTKERVYDRIVDHLDAEGYPTESDPNFKEVNISDLVYATIIPIIVDFRRITGRNSLKLQREKQIISTDSATGGYEEFVVVDLISVKEEIFVLVIEAKRSSLGEAMKQCLLAMKDMRDNNGGVGEVCGFVTTGETWRMLRYDGTSFELTEKIDVLFGRMDRDKERWIKDYSVLVDCMSVALSSGGMIEGDTTMVSGGPLERSERGGVASRSETK